jgi:hypothetical protein
MARRRNNVSNLERRYVVEPSIRWKNPGGELAGLMRSTVIDYRTDSLRAFERPAFATLRASALIILCFNSQLLTGIINPSQSQFEDTLIMQGATQ